MRRPTGRKQIGQILIEKGLITELQLTEALDAQMKTSGQKLGKLLVDLGFVDRVPLYESLAEQLRVPFVDLSQKPPDPKVATLVEQALCDRYRAVPYERGDGCIRVAMAEPDDVIAQDDLKMQLQQAVEPLLADPDSISVAISAAFEKAHQQATSAPDGGGEAAMGGSFGGVDMKSLAEAVRESGSLASMESDENPETRVTMDRIADVADEAPIIKIAKVILQRAIQDRASDIHIEPYQDRVRIRYRIDGVLHDIMQVPKYVQAPLISRFKIMSEMNIAERRVPQAGRIHVKHADRDFALRRREADLPAQRHDPFHRPHGFGQDDDAVLDSEPHQLGGSEHHHHRGPRGVPA